MSTGEAPSPAAFSLHSELRSPDGCPPTLTWQNVGIVDAALPPTCLRGLVVTSHVRGQLALAKFFNVSEQ
jgi:hypothetical protein